MLYSVVFVGLGASGNWIQLAMAITIMTFAEMISKTAMISSIGALAKPHMVGRYMGIFGLVQGLGWGIGPYFGSLLYESFNQSPILLWCQLGTFILISGLGFLFLYSKTEVSTTSVIKVKLIPAKLINVKSLCFFRISNVILI